MKFASRFLLPLEIFVAVITLSWGISGGFGGGLLWVTLSRQGLNAEWGLCLCAVALAQMLGAGLEGVSGRHWHARALLRSVRWRCWSAYAGALAWFYVCFLLITLRGASEVFALFIQAPAALAACILSGLENNKVACLLDPAVSTRKLQSRIMADRRRGWSAEDDPLIRGPH